jgi:hypothetical protein
LGTGQFSKILGASVSTKVAGNTLKVIYTKNTMGVTDKMTGAELILTRAMSGGNNKRRKKTPISNKTGVSKVLI